MHFAHLRPGQVNAFGIAGITDIVSSISNFNISPSCIMRTRVNNTIEGRPKSFPSGFE